MTQVQTVSLAEKGKDVSRAAGSTGLVVGLILIALGVGGFIGWQLLPTEDAVEAAPADVAAVVPPASDPETDETEVAAPAEVEDPAPPAPPAFDIVRIEPSGDAVIAGRAQAGANVSVLLDDALLERVVSDGQDGFAVLTQIPPSTRPRVLSLSMRVDGVPDPILSEETVFVAPTAPAEDRLAAAAPEAESDPTPAPEMADADTVAEATAPETDQRLAEAPDSAAEEEPASADLAEAAEPETSAAQVAAAPTAEDAQAPTELESAATEVPSAVEEAPQIIVADADGVSVVSDTPPEALSSVALDTISYDDAGDISLGGRAPGEGFVRVYIDDQPITSSRIEADGSWTTDLPEIDTGVYRLRVDEVSVDGEVTSRIETPFLREARETVQSTLTEIAPEGTEVAFRTVQPGATLWAIARERYGEGTLYVKVFEANRDQIRDPDLIYPGQVFTLPE